MTIDERVTRQFKAWAQAGQGDLVWDCHVSLEPPFRPFRGYNLAEPEVFDDGRRPGFFSSLTKSLRGEVVQTRTDVLDEDEPEAPLYERGEIADVEILVPLRDSLKIERFAHFLSMTTFCSEPISVELVGTSEGVSVILSAAETDMPSVREQLAAFFPTALCVPRSAPTVRAWHLADGDFAALAEFSLEREFMIPLVRPSFDPYVSLVGVLGDVREGECAIFQTVISPISHPWGEHAMRSVSSAGGRPLFANAPELFDGAKQKFQSPLYAATVRVLSRSRIARRAESVLEGVSAALRAFNGENRLIGHAVTDGIEEGIEDVLFRETRRSGMILSSEEVTMLAHLPTSEVVSPRLIRQTRSTREAPASVIGHKDGVMLGHNEHAGITVPVSVSAEQRTRHTHVIGASGTGKSTLLYNLIRQDIEAGRGVGVIEPHGDLVDKILAAVPEHRVKDVVLLDPADPEFAVGFNMLRAHSDLEKTLIASDLVSVFERLSTSWGDQMGSVLSNAVLAFLESSRGGSLLDLRRFLVETAYRNEFLKTVSDPEVTYYWQKAFPQLTGNKSIGPILTRLDAFLAPKAIRHMVGQRENRLDIADIMDSGKIFLAKLSQGAIGRENSHLLGTLLFSKFQQLSVARQAQAVSSRRDFLLYADEFQNFVTPSMAEILSGGRKYRLGLVLAHQELRQLERNREVASAVMGNAGVRVVFRVGDGDARTLADGFAHFEATDIQGLEVGEALCRVERHDADFNLKVPLLGDPPDAIERAREVVSASQSRYGTKRHVIEEELRSQVATASAAKVESPAPVSPPPAPIVAKVAPVEAPAALPSPTISAPVSRVESPPEPAPVVTPVPAPIDPPTPGRGGKEHKYLQSFIKQWAEGMGWRAVIEAPVPEGTGSVDVVLVKAETTIACEISVTTSIDHEICNLEKCAKGGFSYIVSISPEIKRVREIESASRQGIDTAAFARMRFLSPEGLFAFVQELDAKRATTETTVKGYRVKVNYKPICEADRMARSEEVAAVVAKSLRRLKSRK